MSAASVTGRWVAASTAASDAGTSAANWRKASGRIAKSLPPVAAG
ncbi:hypothetical protein [Amycolatopsis lexingtonensis]